MEKTALVNQTRDVFGDDTLKRQATLTRGVKSAVKDFGTVHVDVALALLNLGDFFEQQNRLDQAELAYRQAADIYELLGVGHELLQAIALRSLATTVFDQGRMAEATSLRTRACHLIISNQ
jgi:tetratricopeptide (TPR) repeat protein